MSRLSAFAALNNDSSDNDDTADTTTTAVLSIEDSTAAFYTPCSPLHTSTFQLDETNTVVCDDGLVIGLRTNNHLLLKGQYTLSCLHGSVIIDNYVLSSTNTHSLTINASNLNSFPSITPSASSNIRITEDQYFTNSSHEFVAMIKLQNFNNNFSTISNFLPQFRNLYNNYNSTNDQLSFKYNNSIFTFASITEFEQNKVSTCIPDYWNHKINHSIIGNDSSLNSKILIIGNKNSGKSTFLKILLNSYLSLSTIENLKIQILDLDPGQPEFCLPGFITLCKIDSPLIGTILPFDQLLKNDNDNNYLKFIGFSSPNIQPINYFNQLNDLISKIDNNSPLIINLPGWVKGFGIEIIKFLINKINIDHLIQLNENFEDLDIINDLNLNDLNNLKISKLPSINLNNYNYYAPNLIRKFKISSYMHYNFNSNFFDFNPLIWKSPFKLSYLTNTLNFENFKKFKGILGISILDSKNIINEDLINSIECQYMVLCLIDLNEEIINSINSINYNKPNLINENYLINQKLDILGYCMIHSVDVKNKFINLYTPLKFSDIPKNKSLILIKGREDVPIEEIYNSSIIKKGLHKLVTIPPYVSGNVSSSIVGSRCVSIRRNILRR